MTPSPPDRRLDEAIRHLAPPRGRTLWHGGPTVIDAIRGIPPEVAAWRPHPDRHSIWALTLHVAYWNYAVWRRITEAGPGGFPRSPSDFPDVPESPTQKDWDADKALVRTWRDHLIAALQSLDPGLLDEKLGRGRDVTYADHVTGIVLHDTYHAGQIRMLERLYECRAELS